MHFVLAPVISWSQNLIRNSSFEEVTECPSDFDQLDKLISWKNVGGTVDVFKECSKEIVPDPPQGPFEYANFKFGDGYLYTKISFPFRLRSDTIFREYIQGELIESLAAGDYYFSLHAYTNQENRTNHLGVYFTENDIGFIGSYPKNIAPQLEFDEWIGGYYDWKKHEGCIDNINGSSYLTIGNFHEPGHDEVEYEDIEFSNGLFLDNIHLHKIPTPSDTTITINRGECLELDSTLNMIPLVYYDQTNKLVGHKICPKNDVVLHQKVSSCDKVLREIIINVVDCSCELFIPNVVSPSGDNINNTRLTVGFDQTCIDDFMKIRVFNRWGNLLYDGQWSLFDLVNFSEGVYVYSIEYQCKGENKIVIGDITILR